MMKDTVIDPVGMTAAETVAALRRNRELLALFQANELVLLAHFADLESRDESTPGGVESRFGEQLVDCGHDGTPQIAEFAALEVAAAFGESVEAADHRLAEALDLRHRHPSLWSLVLAGAMKKWVALQVAQRAAQLDRWAAVELDRRLGRIARTAGPKRLLQIAKAWILELTPVEQRLDDRQRARLSRHVRLGQESRDGISDLTAVLDAGDAITLDQQVGQIAHLLLVSGRSESLDERRALALGMLGRPAQALAFLQAGIHGMLPGCAAAMSDIKAAAECGLIGQPGHTCGQITVDPDRLLPKAEIVVHLSDTALAAGSGVARSEGIGPLMIEWLAEVLGSRRITVRQVLDPTAIGPVDCYEISAAMRESVLLRSPFEAFPGSSRPARRLDLDHTVPYLTGGPPGQTRPDNLAPLSRRVHRAKTFGRWKTRQVFPGVLIWQSPLGYTYVCSPSGSWCIDAPEGLAHSQAA